MYDQAFFDASVILIIAPRSDMSQASKLLDGRADKLFYRGRLASKGKLPNTHLEVQIVTFFL